MATIKENVTRDAAASAGTAYRIAVGEEFEGVLSSGSDEDWVAVNLVAGKSYDIRLEGRGPDAVTDTVLAIYNAAGKQVASNDDIEWEALELSSMLEFSPDESGVYYLSAAAVPLRDLDSTGAYRITLTDEEDNHTDTPHVVTVGGVFQGSLDDKHDEDWIKVDLVAGKTYDVTLRGLGADAGLDTFLKIYDTAGEELARNDDVDFDAGRIDSQLTFTPDAGGAYYLVAGAYTDGLGANAGRYRVAVHEVGVNYAVTLAGTDASEYYHTRLTGGIGDDTLDGNGGWDWLEGGPGADRLSGGTGIDRVSYQYSNTGVEVRLYDGTARGGDAEGDTFPGRQTVEQAAQSGRTQEADTATAGTVSSPSPGDAVAVARAVEVPDIEDLFGSAHNDVLAGAAGPNWLSGYYGDDVLDGREGNDLLDGGAGADALIGGAGNDAALYLYSPEGVHVRLYDGTAKGGYAEGDTFPGTETVVSIDAAGKTQTAAEPDVEDLYGSFHNDALAGNHRANLLRGFDGHDRLDGRAGSDVLEGGPGADRLIGGPGEDTASYLYSPAGVDVRLHSGAAKGGDARGDTFAGTDVFAWTDADGKAQQTQVPDIEHLYGSAHNDVLAGDGRDNDLSGGPGHDTLYGGPRGGDDTLNGGAGNDKLYGGKGDDTLQGGAGADALNGGPDNDTLEGGPGADALNGGPGADTASYLSSPAGVVVRLHSGALRGGDADGDTFAGTDAFAWTDADGNAQQTQLPDVEHLHGSAHNDVLAGDGRDNHIFGDAGNDTLYGGPLGGDDLLDGGDGNDKLYGGKGDDALFGGPGADLLKGGSGADRLQGGPGNDRLDGGAGADVFVLTAAGGNDTILDFNAAEDKIDLAAFATLQSVSDLTMRRQAGDTIIDLSAQDGGTVTLEDFSQGLTAAHFIFHSADDPAIA